MHVLDCWPTSISPPALQLWPLQWQCATVLSKSSQSLLVGLASSSTGGTVVAFQICLRPPIAGATILNLKDP